MLGKKHSAETIDKIKEIRLLKYARSVTCVTTGEMFDSVNRAAYYYNIHSSNIVQCCKGKLKHTGKLDGKPLEWQYTTGMKYNEFKKLASSLGVDCKGTRDEIMARVVALGVVTDAEESAEEAPVEKKESKPVAGKSNKSASVGKGGLKKADAPTTDEFDAQADTI